MHAAYSGLGAAATRLENGVHPKHRLMRYHDFFIGNINTGDKVIDVGCGTGIVAVSLSRKAGYILGVDLDKKCIDAAEKRKKMKKIENCEFRCLDVTKEKLSDTFDAIVLSNVLEHIDDRIKLLRNLCRLGNVLLLRVPMVDRDWVTLYKKEIGMNYTLDPTHRIEYTGEQLVQELRDGGWRIKASQVKFGETWAVCEGLEKFNI
jgi:SAM-dependent methyltransferase